jgi:hypothetical protein
VVERYLTWEIGRIERRSARHAALGRLDEHPFGVKQIGVR